MKKRMYLGLALLLVSHATIRAQDKPTSKDLKPLFERAETIALYSLDPSIDDKQPDPTKGFHGWKILGKTAVGDAKTRKKLVEAFYKGLADSDGQAARCFNPRHGLRVTVDGKTVDIVLCFECLQAQFVVGEASQIETINRAPEKLFDEVLTNAGVPLSGKKM